MSSDAVILPLDKAKSGIEKLNELEEIGALMDAEIRDTYSVSISRFGRLYSSVCGASTASICRICERLLP